MQIFFDSIIMGKFGAENLPKEKFYDAKNKYFRC